MRSQQLAALVLAQLLRGRASGTQRALRLVRLGLLLRSGLGLGREKVHHGQVVGRRFLLGLVPVALALLAADVVVEELRVRPRAGRGELHAGIGAELRALGRLDGPAGQDLEDVHGCGGHLSREKRRCAKTKAGAVVEVANSWAVAAGSKVQRLISRNFVASPCKAIVGGGAAMPADLVTGRQPRLRASLLNGSDSWEELSIEVASLAESMMIGVFIESGSRASSGTMFR